MPEFCAKPHGCRSDHELTGCFFQSVVMTVSYRFFTNPTSSQKVHVRLIFVKGLKTSPNEENLQQTKKEHFSWKTSMGWSGHFLLQLQVILAPLTILRLGCALIDLFWHFPPRRFQRKPLRPHSPVCCAQFQESWDGPERILMGTFQSMK